MTWDLASGASVFSLPLWRASASSFRIWWRILDRRRHQLGRLVRRIAEHDALVARALFLVARSIDALGDVLGLAVQQDFDVGIAPAEAFLIVADVLDRHARVVGDQVLGDGVGAAELAGDDDLVGGGQRFGRATQRPDVETLLDRGAVIEVHHLVRDAVADLVRVSLGHAFAGEKVFGTRHAKLPSGNPAAIARAGHIKKALYDLAEPKPQLELLSACAVAGLRAVFAAGCACFFARSITALRAPALLDAAKGRQQLELLARIRPGEIGLFLGDAATRQREAGGGFRRNTGS